MNYEKIYLQLCTYCKKTTPRERLSRRNPQDIRLESEFIYTETHHILPKSLGGSDDNSNLVVLLPEEHLIAHQLRWKAYKEKQDFLAIRFIINGFLKKGEKRNDTKLFSKKFLNLYSWFRQNIYEFRKNNKWHSEEGIRSISRYRKGKIPGKCAKTGKILGEFDVNDPRVLSGEIIHHSKGMHTYEDPITKQRVFCSIDKKPPGYVPVKADFSGNKNPKYSGITDDEIYNFCEQCVIIFKQMGYKTFPPLKKISKLWGIIDTSGRKFPNLAGGLRSGFRFKGDFQSEVIDKICSKHHIEHIKQTKEYKDINYEEVKNAYNRIFGRN